MRINRIILLVLTGIIISTAHASAQKSYTFKASISVDGTSNTHDWTVKSDNNDGSFSVDNDNKVTSLSIKVSVESLKSILDSKFERKQMENLVLKAFNSEKYPNISFQITEPFVPC
jgi:polyisoprenoid-binding protein YceI